VLSVKDASGTGYTVQERVNPENGAIIYVTMKRIDENTTEVFQSNVFGRFDDDVDLSMAVETVTYRGESRTSVVTVTGRNSDGSFRYGDTRRILAVRDSDDKVIQEELTIFQRGVNGAGEPQYQVLMGGALYNSDESGHRISVRVARDDGSFENVSFLGRFGKANFYNSDTNQMESRRFFRTRDGATQVFGDDGQTPIMMIQAGQDRQGNQGFHVIRNGRAYFSTESNGRYLAGNLLGDIASQNLGGAVRQTLPCCCVVSAKICRA